MTEPLVQGRFVKPETVVTHFHLKEGDAVADIGAGSGYFLPALAGAVGSSGTIYACEIQRLLVERMNDLVTQKRLNSVEILWCDAEATNGLTITDESIDVAVMVNSLFQLVDKQIALKEVARTLKAGGRLYIVDWSDSFGGLGPQPKEVLDKEACINLVEGEGFIYETEYDAGDHHYGVAFRKP